jgi:hypothetical protein
VLPATAPTGTSPPTSHLPPSDQQSGILRTAWRAWRAWCVAPWHRGTWHQYAVYSISLFAAYVAFLHVVLQLLLEYRVQGTRYKLAQAVVLLGSCMVMSFPPPASLYLVYNFLACQNSCHGRNFLRIFACRSAVTGQRNSAFSVVGIATIPIVLLFHP